ncbi:hypothetical protein CEXT_750101 [Caerostris extrusa]|uniref:Uncharacterized protein n=1 Tax=Caerostris extrusa TaxID=172846 RepID=A0AAV4NVD6_CAEEX|nr:hypothetical protein CEXT_750101 [Caerostris extrusa]
MLDGPEKTLPAVRRNFHQFRHRLLPGKTLGKYMMAPSSLFKVPSGNGSIKMLDGPEKDSACRPTQLPSIPPSTTAWGKTLGENI